MVKKRYIVPELLVVQLASCDALLQSISAQTDLGVSFRGGTSTNSIGEADVKEQNVSDVNLWDKEW